MACKNSTSPINISKNEINDECFLKCLYKYNYPVSPATTVTNNGNHLTFSYDKVRIKFNNDKLLTGDIHLYAPSLHTFNNKHADAELIINHMDAGISLLVCIPISISNSTNEPSKELKALLEQAMEKTPNIGETTVIPTKNFTLNSFIPKKKGFYSYVATLPYEPCNGTHQYVVYMPEDSQVYLNSETMRLLSKIIVEHKYGVKKAGEVFYNKRGAIFEGASESSDDNDIYIECHPTGSEGEEPVQLPIDSSIKISEPINFKNPVVITIIGLLAGLIVIYLISIILSFFRTSTPFSFTRRPVTNNPVSDL